MSQAPRWCPRPRVGVPETSRLDLTDFQGKQLEFRWTEHGKDFADLLPANWWLDNATIYTCSK